MMRTGDHIDARYELVRLVGEGGMGSVWEGVQLETGRRVAIKVLHEHLADEAEAVARFFREARAALEARYSGHVIEVIDVVRRQDGPPCLVMEYLEGEDLGRIAEREGRLDPERAVGLVIQACHALAEVHRQGLIHRDVKPENLFVTTLPDGSEWIKLLDFGVVKIESGERGHTLTKLGTTLGTPEYMAPEQVEVDRVFDHRVDVYGLGVVLFRLLTGTLPFEGADARALMLSIARDPFPSPRSRAPGISEELEAVILAATARDPDARLGSVYELAERLESLGGGERRARADEGRGLTRADATVEARVTAPFRPHDEGQAATTVLPALRRAARWRWTPVVGVGVLVVLAVASVCLLTRSDPAGGGASARSAREAGSAPAVALPGGGEESPVDAGLATDAGGPAASARDGGLEPPVLAGGDGGALELDAMIFTSKGAVERGPRRRPSPRAMLRATLRSLSPGVRSCLRGGTFSSRRVLVRFRLGVDGALTYQSASPRPSRPVALCLARVARGRRLRGARLREPMVVSHAYAVPR